MIFIQGFLKNKVDVLVVEGVNYVLVGCINIVYNLVLQVINQNGGKKVVKVMIVEIKVILDVIYVILFEMFFCCGFVFWFDEYFLCCIKCQIKVIVYICWQDKYVEVMYKQCVKNGCYQGDFEDFVCEQIDFYYGCVLCQFFQVFGQENIVVCFFEW